GDNFNPPDFVGFNIVGGPNQAVSTSWMNGKRSYKKTYSYFLSPKQRGSFTIKQATIEIDGEIYKTTPQTIVVTAAVDRPNDDNNPDTIASNSIHLVAEVSNGNPYLNEAITVVYKLYVSPDTGVRNWREIDNPRYNDFWSQNIDIKNLKVLNGTYKGEDYRYVVLRKTVLYPQKTGKLDIEPLSLDVTVEVPTNRRDVFGGRLFTQTHKVVTAGSRAINVKALPEEGKPADFTGAVGQFDFNVIPSKTDLKASESFTLKVDVKGKGNLKLFELPQLNLPGSLEVYEPEFDEQISTNISGMQGKVTNNYTIVPQYKGKYPIPGVSFSYFDPKAKKYKTISSQEILINVFEGPVNSASNNSSPIVGTYKQPITATGSQFQFIKLKANFQPKTQKEFFNSKLFYGLLFGPLLLIPLFILAGKKKQAIESDVEGNRIRKANRLTKKYLSEAKKAIGQKEAFYEAMERALHNYLKAKLKIETSDLSKDKISDLLLSKNVEQKTVNNF